MSVDYDRLAIEWLDMIEETDCVTNNMALIAFGVLPKIEFDAFIDTYMDMYIAKITGPGGSLEGWPKEGISTSFITKKRLELEKEMTNAIFRNARMVV